MKIQSRDHKKQSLPGKIKSLGEINLVLWAGFTLRVPSAVPY